MKQLVLALLLFCQDGTYLGRPVATTMHWLGAEWLIREERENEEHVAHLIELLQLEPGDVVCDLGAGNGRLSLPMARLVEKEQGLVYAVDIQEPMLELLRERAAKAEVANVRAVLGEEADFPVPDDSCDLVLMVDVYHELSRPAEMLASITRVLGEDGQLCLAEYRLEDPTVPIKRLHKMSQAQILREMAENGYRWVRGSDALPRQHLVFFEADLFEDELTEELRERLIAGEFAAGWLRALGTSDARLLVPFYAEEVEVDGSALGARRLAADWLRRARTADAETWAARIEGSPRPEITRTEDGALIATLTIEGLGTITLSLARQGGGALHVVGESHRDS